MLITENRRLPFAQRRTGSAARAQFVAFLRAHDGFEPSFVDEAVIVLGEMIANAVRHGQPRHDGMIEVGWCLDGDELGLIVRDGGHVDHVDAHRAAPEDVGGRGLFIIDLLCERWWLDDDNGTCVHAYLRARRG